MSRNRGVAGAGAISRSSLSASTFSLTGLNRIDYGRAYLSVTALPSPVTRDRSEGCQRQFRTTPAIDQRRSSSV